VDILDKKIKKKKALKYLLDGFPRSKPQAILFE